MYMYTTGDDIHLSLGKTPFHSSLHPYILQLTAFGAAHAVSEVDNHLPRLEWIHVLIASE